MTSLRYFAEEAAGSDSPVGRVTLVNRFGARARRSSGRPNQTHSADHNGSPDTLFTELLELDEHLLDSIDDYLSNSSLRRNSRRVIEDEFDGPPLGSRPTRVPKSRSANATTTSSINPPTNQNGPANSTGASNNTLKTNRTDGGTSSGHSGRSWSTKFSNLGMNKERSSSTEPDSRDCDASRGNTPELVPYVESNDPGDFPNTFSNSIGSTGGGWSGLEEVIDLIDNTPPKIAIGAAKSGPAGPPAATYDLTREASNFKNDQNVGPVNGGVAFEDDIPIRKSKRRIICDSQRYTSDSGIAKHDPAAIDDSLPLFDAGNGTGANTAAGNAGASTVTPTNKMTSSSRHCPSTNLSTRSSVNNLKTSGLRTLASSSFDSDSSEEEDFDECIICSESMKSELKNEIGVLDVCSHIFCFKCIKMWSDRANSCPLCKREFIHIRKVNLYNIQDLIEKYYLLASGAPNASDSPYARVGAADGSNSFNRLNSSFSIGANSSGAETKSLRERRLRCIRKNKISKLKKIINEKINWFELIPSVKVKVEHRRLQEEEDEGCTICGNDDNWAQLLLCDSCDKGYHIYCLDPPLSRVPDSNWYCAQCVALGHSGRPGSAATGRSARGLSGLDMGPGVVASLTCARAGGEERLFNIDALPASAVVNRNTLRFVGDSVISISSSSRLSSARAERPRSRRLRNSAPSPVVTDSEEEQMRTSLLSQVYSSLNRRSPSATSRAISSIRGAAARKSRSASRKGKRAKKRSKRSSSSSSSRSTSSSSSQRNSSKTTSTAHNPKNAKADQTPSQASVSSSTLGTSTSSRMAPTTSASGFLYRRDLNIKNIDQLIQESLESIDNYLLFNTNRSLEGKLDATADTAESTAQPSEPTADPAAGSAPTKPKSVHFPPGLTPTDSDHSHSDFAASFSTGSSASNPSQASSSSYAPSGEPSGGAGSVKDKKYTSFVYRYRTLTSERSSRLAKPEPHISGKTVKYLF